MQVRKLFPNKEMRVAMTSLRVPKGSRMQGAIVSPGGHISNWIEREKEGEGGGRPQTKKVRLLEAFENTSEEELVPAGSPKKPQRGKRSGGRQRKEKSSKKNESEHVEGGGSIGNEREAVIDDHQGVESIQLSLRIEKEQVEKVEEVAMVRPGPKLTPEVAAKWRAVGATSGLKQSLTKPTISSLQSPAKVIAEQSGHQKIAGKTLSAPDSSGISESTKALSTSAPSVGSESTNTTNCSGSNIVKQEPVPLDYSQVGEEEVITLDDSEEEDNYDLNFSQVISNSMLDDEVDDILVDSPVPSPDLDHSSSPEQSDEDSDVEILEILNNSQTALFAKIYKSVHKVEPDVKIKMQMAENEEIDNQESQSLLVEEEEEEDGVEMENVIEDPDAGLISKVLAEVTGCDENMVRGAIRKVKVIDGQLSPDQEDHVVALAREEVEEAMVTRVAKEVEGMAELQVKICLCDLKEKQDGEVTEIMLLQSVREQKEEEDILQKLAEDDPLFTEENVRKAMKTIGVESLTMMILPEIRKQLKQLEKGEEEMINEVIEAERVDVEENAMTLSKVFNVSFEVAKEKLEAAGLNVELASQALLEADKDDQVDVDHCADDDDGLDDLDLEDLARSNSPELVEMEEKEDSVNIPAGTKGDKPGSTLGVSGGNLRGVETSLDKSLDDVDDLLGGLSDEDEPPASSNSLAHPPSVTLLSTHLMSLITTTAPPSTSSTAPTSVKDGTQIRTPTHAEKEKASFKNQVYT